MSIKLVTLPALTLSAGVATKISTEHVGVTAISFQADDSNVGNIYIGDSTVTSSTGMILSKGNTASLSGDSSRGWSEEFHLDEVYVVASSSNDIVRLSCFKRKP